MREAKHEAGYIGKHDCLRENAKKLLKNDISAKEIASPPSMSAREFTQRRPYKKGGHVDAPRNKAARMSELHIPGLEKQKKLKMGKEINSKTGFLPQHPDKLKKGGEVKVKYAKPIIAGKHPMIGMKEKSPKISMDKMPKVNKSVKAKSQPYDASRGMYLRKGGKVK
jgi:hypothetical protein